MKPAIAIYPNMDALIHATAERVADTIEQALQGQKAATLVLTGGKTPKPVYEILGSPPYLERIDWKRIHFFWGDERCVPPEDPESNFGMAWNALISKLGVSSDHIHRMKGEMEDTETAASLYENEIRKVTKSEVPSFDMVLLGMGADGHVASLFPGTSWNEEKLVVANHVPQTGVKRISMTPRILNEARTIIFIVAGAEKSKALDEVLGNPASHMPAARIHPVSNNLIWMVDKSAAGSIPDSKFQIPD
jgi:6-phosphogluconolactonase